MKKGIEVAAAISVVAVLALFLLQPVITGLVVDNSTSSVIARVFVVGNRAPVLDTIGDQTATEGFIFTLQVTANDADGNTLAYSDNSSLFEINSSSGFINFTPAFADIGNHSTLITVTDGNLSDSESFNLQVKIGLFCGDSICSGSESCLSCSADCGSCPDGGGSSSTSSGTGSGSGGAGSSGAAASTGGFFGYSCQEKWTCTEWSACIDGLQSRECSDDNKCRTSTSKPSLERECLSQESSSAQAGQCSNGVKDSGEDDIDCGGICAPCVIKRFASIPIPQISFAEITKQFPWVIMLVTGILAGIMAGADRTYTFYVKKLKFDHFRKKEASYRPWRRRIHTAIYTMLILGFAYSVYVYYYSFSFSDMLSNAWVMGVLSVITPAIVYTLIRKTEYSEYRYKVARQRLQRIHERQMWQLAKLENETLLRIEEKSAELLNKLRENSEYASLESMREIVRQLFDLHAKEVGVTEFPEKVRNTLASVAVVPASYHNYPELERLAEDIKKLSLLVEGDESGMIETAGNFLDSVREIARDNLLISVITADKEAVSHYNRVVDLYSYFDGLGKARADSLKQVAGSESSFLQMFESAFGNDFVSAHSSDPVFVSAYNRLVELYDHYKKNSQQ